MYYRFGDFELDPGRFELRRDGEPIGIQPRPLALLLLLVELRDRLIEKNEIMDRLWDGRSVSDAALAAQAKEVRKALGDDGRSQRYILTVCGKGFRFTAKIEPVETSGPAVARQPIAAIGEPPALAILPFRTIGIPGPAPITEGLPDELITALARLHWLRVIARASSFKFRSGESDLASVHEAFGVRYCLSGSVEHRADALTIIVELADTEQNSVIWGDRFTARLEGIHDLRQDIIANILAEIDIQIPAHEARHAARASMKGILIANGID